MNKMRYAVKLNMKDVGTFNTGIRLKQGDSAITFVFRIYSGDNYLFNESDVPHIVFKRPDGSSVVGEMSVIEGQYTYNFKGNELEIGGNVIADVKFNMYGDRSSTSSFMFECVPDTLSTISQVGGVYVNDLQHIYEDILNKYSRLDQLIHEFDYESIQQDIGDITTTLNEVRNLNAELKSLVPVNNLLATVPGSPLDAVQGKALSDSINSLTADLTNIKGEYLQNTDIFAWASSKKITSTCFAETNCLNTPGAGQGYAISLFVSGGGIKNMYAVSGSTREVYVSIFNTVAWTAWKQVSYTMPQLFYMTLNSTYCESSYSNCYRLGNIAILSLYLNVRNISGYDKLLLATLPFNVINASLQNCLLTGGERGILYLENDGSLKFHANGTSVTQSAILTQMLVVIDE